jgi:hypothetical protein
MNLLKLLRDDKFNVFFSLMLGIGIICIIRPICTGSECAVKKAPSEKDFDQFVYRVGGDKCYSFKTETVECPTSGVIESFRESPMRATPVQPPTLFAVRSTPILSCE